MVRKIIQVIIDVIDTIAVWSAKIFSILFIPLMLLMVYEVFTRRVLGQPTVWTYEMARFLFVPLIMMCIGYTHLQGGHASIDLLYGKMSRRGKAITNVLTHIFLLGWASILAIQDTLTLARMSWASLERTPSAFNAPIYPVKTFMPIGFILVFLVCISVLLKNGYFLATNEPIQSKIMTAELGDEEGGQTDD